MGTGEEITPPKPSKAASSTQQEMPSMPVTPSYPDWSSSMQAFYGGAGAPPFFPPSATSPTPHPFIWGGQHPMMPPYGTPVPYPTMYHHGVYPHPNMPMAQAPLQGNTESDGKASEGKDRSSKKTKATSGSGNDVGTQSGESGSEGSSDHSDDKNNNSQELSGAKKGSFNQMLADGASTQNNASNLQTSLVPGNPVPPTNLNIGMDLWPSGSAAVKLRPNRPGVVASSGTTNDQWIQDERELKKQKRKQSNRESARKSRLRKQAECEELQHRVETLSEENQSLREELRRLSEECEKLTSENNSIKEELTKLCGSESVSQQLDEGNC